MPTENRTGGPANLNGVHYQLLRSLFHATRIIHLDLEPGDEPHSSRIVLEPHAGGDLRVEQQRAVIIEQMKTRPGGTWALKETIEKVLPDLFKAFSAWGSRLPVSKTIFVTDGKRGNWKSVEDLFHDLPAFDEVQDRALQLLDDQTRLKIRATELEKEMISSGLQFTARGLVSYIAHRLTGSKNPLPGKARLLWEFLRAFHFEHVTEDNLKKEIRAFVLGRCLRSEDCENITRSLLAAFLDRGRDRATIVANDLLADHGLAEVDLGDWQQLSQRARRHLDETLTDRSYTAAWDVRASRWNEPSEQPIETSKPVIFVGESGQGKSWTLAARARRLITAENIVILIEAAEDLATTRDLAAKVFCHKIWDLDGAIPLDRIQQRLKKVSPSRASEWLHLLIDNIQDPKLAKRLLAYDWQREGISLTLSLIASSGATLTTIEPLCQLEEISDFSAFELAEYLHIRLGDLASRPFSVRRGFLRRPILARIFCDLTAKAGPGCQPTNEFDLLSNYWSTFSEDRPLSVNKLAMLASEPPANRDYPWSSLTLGEAGLAELDVKQLVTKGLLSSSADGQWFKFRDDKLLNWAVATGWALKLRDGRITLSQLVEEIQLAVRNANREGCWGHRWLGMSLWYLLWILLDPKRAMVDKTLSIIQQFQYEMKPDRLASLGDRIILPLFESIRANPRRSWWAVQTLQAIESNDVAGEACRLLKEADTDLRVAAAEILTKRPTASALDDLWTLRCELEADEPKRYNDIYCAVDGALTSCGRLEGSWIRQRIRSADPSREPVHELVYLLPQVSDGKALWFELKEIIFNKVSSEKERCIAVCIESFRDSSHLDWLKERIHSEGTLSGAARRALLLLEPGRRPDPIEDELQDAAYTRGWWLRPHLNTDAAAAEALIAETIARAGDPWQITWSLLSGFESRIAPDTLDRLLDSAAELFAAAGHSTDEETLYLSAPLVFLGNVKSLRLLDRFAARRGSSLEQHIVRWFRRCSIDDQGYHDFHEGHALRILKRISGEGLTEVGNYLLRCCEQTWSLLMAIEVAVMRPDEETVRLLADLASRDQLDDSHVPVAQWSAIGALVELGRSDIAIEAVLRWGQQLTWTVVNRFRERRPTLLDLAPALRFLRADSAPVPTAVIALGLGGHREHVPVVRDILQRAAGGSDLARACVLALCTSGDRTAETVTALASQISFAETEWAVAEALLTIGTSEALAVLMSWLEQLGGERLAGSTHAQAVARALLLRDETGVAAAKLLWQSVKREKLTFVAGRYLGAFAALRNPAIDNWLYELAFSEVGFFDDGARLGAISVLSDRDPTRAFRAARQLREAGGADPGEILGLLLKIDQEQSLRLFREELERGNEILAMAAIGEHVYAEGHSARILEWLADPVATVREGACIACEFLPWGDELAWKIRDLLYDDDWDVRNAANVALDCLWHAREIDRIVDRIVEERDKVRQWCLLDITFEEGYPGLWKRQPWVAKLGDHLPLTMRQLMRDKLKKRRKEVREGLKKRKRAE